jgi:hypothetical protein
MTFFRARTAFARGTALFFAASDQSVPFHTGSGTPAVQIADWGAQALFINNAP